MAQPGSMNEQHAGEVDNCKVLRQKQPVRLDVRPVFFASTASTGPTMRRVHPADAPFFLGFTRVRHI